MRIPTWRLALTGGAILVLALVGAGLVAASASAPPAPATAPAAAASGAPTSSGGPVNGPAALGPRLRARLGAIFERPFARRLVHATVTVTGANGQLVTLQLDHGTIASIGSGALTISEAGGGSVTVSTDTNTVVFLGGGAGRGSLSDLKVGDQVFVQSRVDGGTTFARHILRIPTTTGG